MPLYEYECDACHHRFEVIQKFSDAPIEKCPKCGSPVHKLMSSPAIQFKGSGWYITDYAKKDQIPGKSSSSPSSDSGTKSSEASKKSNSEKTESSSSKPAESPSPSTKKD